MNSKTVASYLSWQYVTSIWISAIALAAVTYLQPATHLGVGGLDQSWAYAINVAFHKGWVMGRDIYFTFGPLGFLEHTRVVSLDMLYASFTFSFLISVALNAALLHLACLSSEEKLLQLCNLVIAITIVVFTFPHMQRLLLCSYALVFLHWFTGRQAYLLLLGLVVALCVLIKFSYGAMALSLWCGYALILCWKRRGGILWAMAFALLASYWGSWALIYGHLEGSIGYLLGQYYLAKGNASAMALNPDNNWIAIILFYTFVISAGLLAHLRSQGRCAWLPLVFILPLLVWTKYTFNREDSAHMFPIMAFAAWFMGLCALVVYGLRQKLMIVILLGCTWYAWIAMHTPSIGPPDFRNAPHSTLGQPEIVRYNFQLEKMFDMWRTAERKLLAPLLLPDAMRNTIGDSSVDIYPWELTIASINELNLHPRPLLQTYIANVPFLDKKNSDHYRDDSKAPEFIIWHHHSFQDIANRYSLSSEPLTIESILNHYELLYCESYVCLWQRTAEPRIESVTLSEPVSAHWNEWIRVPDRRGDILRVKLEAKRTLLGDLNLMLWKEAGITIDYKMTNGAIKTHDLLIDNAVSGVWISPYVDNYLGSDSTPPAAISQAELNAILSSPAAQGNLEKVELAFNGQHVVGWAGATGSERAPEESHVLFYNDDSAFLFATGLYDRADVVSAFAGSEQTISSKSGFDDKFNERLLPDGTYRLRLVVKRSGQWAATPDQGHTVTVGPDSGSRIEVQQIRIRASRPWAFAKEVQLRWQQLSLH